MDKSKFLAINNKQNMEESKDLETTTAIYDLKQWVHEKCSIGMVNNQKRKEEILSVQI